ncbi:dienelactone hydrolase family protein [uncultured Sunxiuqinia sp.]|jgi:carboxymethylenebutenolidase|uniref:dienelactone hydrolase family protein n=1 Tax=uncultured Sunxiuqinia sp. TaxID=1573825 RepID=UPI0030DB32D7|tara:strand:+ start:63681 stop:64478 length:798 start_codon:yes stop_codon:yes gene_type:complete
MVKIVSLIVFVLFLSEANAQDFARRQLEASPRHHEWVKVKSGEREVHCFVVFPEVSKEATVAIVIHENRGLTDWVRSFSDQLAKAGYIAVAPDMLSDFSTDYQKTSDFPSSDDARNAIYELAPEQVKNDLNAVQSYAAKMQAGNGKTVAIGFCWGGSQSFRFATNNDKLKAALVFYGSAPESASEIERITAPVYGFYGENDSRINSGIPATEKMMKEAGKIYDYVIYDGAGHAYMRQGDAPEELGDNKKARDESWKRIKTILSEI